MIKLGIIGISTGNGHPYSWSAIFNGYNPEAMKDCGFSVISSYLSDQRFPEATITNAEVTHVWAQSRGQAEHIALSAKIANVVDSPEHMVGEIDALLLARDDSENHLRFALPFIRAGLPVYVDKPLALSKERANYFFDFEQYPAQIFSCSALRFSNELLLTPEDRAMLGDIKHVSGRVPKGWDKYIIHAVDPILQNIGYQGEISDVSKLILRDRTFVNLRWGSGITCSLQSFGDLPVGIEIVFVGTEGSKRLTFSDSFSAFKNALQTFIDDSVVNRISHKENVLQTVELIELGI